MKTKILIIGTGGQGVKSLGEIVAEAAFYDELWPCCYTQYTPAARGGDVISSVIISDEPPDYPLVEKADFIFIMSSNKILETEFLKDKITPGTFIVSFDPDLPDGINCRKFIYAGKVDKTIPLNIYTLALIQENIPAPLTDLSVKKATEKILGKKKRD